MASDELLDQAIDQLEREDHAHANNASNKHRSHPRPSRSVSLISRASGFSHESLVRPGLTFADEEDSLMGIQAPSHIAPNRSILKRIWHVHHYPKQVVLPLTCLSIALNALTANGPYVWPTYGPIVTRQLGLTVTQSQTVVLGGILGTYFCAAPLGRFSDKKGPRAASLLSAILSFIGYQSFSLLLIYHDRFGPSSLQLGGDSNIDIQFSPLAILLALSYFLLGAAAIGAYFSALTTASLNFPKFPTLALSIPLSCFGLSSLALTSLARITGFWDENGTFAGELNPIRFTRILGLVVPAINIFASIWLFVSPGAVDDYPEDPTMHVNDEIEQEVDPEIRDPSSGAKLWPDLSASLHQELDSHGHPHSPLRNRSGMLRAASVASSYKILDPTEHTPLLIGGPEALYAEVLEDSASGKYRRGPSRSTSLTRPRNSTPSRLATQANTADVVGDIDAEMVTGPLQEQVDWDFKSMAKDKGLWAFGAVMLLGVGPAEMVFSSIGSILNSVMTRSQGLQAHLSLLQYHMASTSPLSGLNILSTATTMAKPDPSLALRSRHVLYLSVSSTAARLCTGVVADYLSPINLPQGSTRRTVRRSVLAALSLFLLAGVFLWGALGLETERGLTAISIGAGISYGMFFTITPAITSKHFGAGHFGLAWGMVSYFGAAGAIIFSYLFALISEYQAGLQRGSPTDLEEERQQCYGNECFEITFWVSAVACVMAATGMLMLGKRWRL